MRFALVMYGGVSLAIYMYGVAQELLNLVKATAPERPESSDGGALAFEDDETTLPVYRKLSRLLGREKDADGPVRVRFVVDLISGSSAGGLNGVCLATALANDLPGAVTQLGSLEKLWVQEGDLETLFAGEDSARDGGVIDDNLRMPEAPPSLLNGLRFYKLLMKTLRDDLACEPSVSPGSRLVDQLDLWVTATDLDGRPVSIPIQNATVSERDHAYRFHFVYDPARPRNDFTKDYAPLVAFAGRSTSSFPVAFEPMRLETILPFSDIGKDWPGLYPEYEAQRFRQVPFSDGGILDNKPFSYATQELARRPATLPVTRYLVYVEPDPKPSEAEVASREWNAQDTALAALIGIPRSETIRGDLELVRRRNQAIQRARELLSLSALTATERKNLAKMVPRLEPADWLAMGFSTMVDAQPQYGPTYPVYHRLKVSVVCDSLARLLARTLGVDEEGEEMPKLRAIVDVWKRDRYAEEPSPPAAGSEFPLTETQFLFRFDMPFRMRRLAFLLTTLSEAAPAFDREDVQALRNTLTMALTRLGEVERRLPEDPLLAASLVESGIHGGTLTSMDAEDDEGLRAQVPEGISKRGDPFDRIVLDAVKDATEQAGAAVDQALGERLRDDEIDRISEGEPVALARMLRFYYDAFEGFDLIYLPLSYETAIADTNPVKVIRVSPLDAEKPVGVSRTLKGSALNHFAAFTDATWRRHDIAWGRLNAAEILIRNLLPDDEHAADSLIDEAHQIIRAQYIANAETVPGRQTTVRASNGQEVFAGVPVTEQPPRALLRRAATIASATTEKQLQDEGRATSAKAVKLTTRAAQGAGVLTLLRDLYGLLPAPIQVVTWVMPILLLSAVAVLVLLGVLASGAGATILFSVAALVLGLLVGVGGLIVGIVAMARSRIRKTIDKALDRN